ncbi:MAG: dihydrodipicolinate synthase family protein [Mycobacterium sp.]|jgi:4-hydroxy-tetrahydrodipicolinate synthase|nr:dihydrodipicolinate synthase family protein [Mycobacterium sp.]
MTTPAALERGLWGILATPFAGADTSVDTESLTRQVSLFTDIGAAGVVALGVFGEGSALSSAEQAMVVSTVVNAARGASVIAGLSALRTAPAIEQGHTAVEAGGGSVRALMVQLHSPRAEHLIAHLHAIHDACGVGIVAQDYPVASGVSVATDVLAEVVRACPFVVAVKAEAPPTALAIARLTAQLEVPVFGGLGGVGLIDELAAGAAGAMTGFSRPEALLEAIRAYDDGGVEAAHRAYAKWLPLANFETQPGIGLALRKEALRRRGILAEASVRAPAPAFPAELGNILSAHLDALDVHSGKLVG